MNSIAITGASGYIGQRLLNLLKTVDVEIIAVDIKAPSIKHPRLVFYQKDIRDPALQSIFEKHQVKTVIHLAFLIPPFPFNAETSFDINVNGMRNVLKACEARCVKQLIYTSSGIVYSLSGNGKQSHEEDELKETPGLEYGSHKIETEKLILQFKKENPEKIVTIFRPSPMIGPHAASCVTLPFKNKWIVVQRNVRARVQYIHEEDVCGAIMAAWRQEKPGTFNLGADGYLELKSIFKKAGVRLIHCPDFLFRAWYALLWKLKLSSVSHTMMEKAFDESLIMDTHRLKTVLNYQPQYTTEQAVASFLNP
jgi:UDP-glucose 4-epimerase